MLKLGVGRLARHVIPTGGQDGRPPTKTAYNPQANGDKSRHQIALTYAKMYISSDIAIE